MGLVSSDPPIAQWLLHTSSRRAMFFEQELQLFANVGFSPTEPVELFLEKRQRSLRNIVELTSQVLLH